MKVLRYIYYYDVVNGSCVCIEFRKFINHVLVLFLVYVDVMFPKRLVTSAF